jgi:hypothetical protein
MDKGCTDVNVCVKACEFCYCWVRPVPISHRRTPSSRCRRVSGRPVAGPSAALTHPGGGSQVCDEPYKKCPKWREHCACDGMPEWNMERQKIKRQKESALRQEQDRRNGKQQDTADAAEIRRRYERDAAGDNTGAARTQTEEEHRENREQQAEDEEGAAPPALEPQHPS